MSIANNRHTPVFMLIDSPVIIVESVANTIVPTQNCITRPGHTCPSNAIALNLAK